MMMMGGSSSWHPFTASQWQELELQALIFKYMASGVPVPPDLILCIRRNHLIDPQTFPCFPHPPSIGWGMYQMGDARKAVDPEPGRCRRTDGKKWRCSKEAYPDSKYCERHMHRGKSRSRKPVELSLATNPSSSHFSSSNFPPLSLSTPPAPTFPFPCSSSSRPAALGHYSSPPDAVDSYRNVFGFREDVNEYPFFSETCRAGRETPSFADATKEKFGRLQSSAASHYKIGLPEEEDKERQQYFVSGSDFKSEKVAKLEKEEEEQQQSPLSSRPFHCFLDEKPHKLEGSWMNMSMKNMDMDQSKKTQLAMSISMANHSMPVTAPQRYNEG